MSMTWGEIEYAGLHEIRGPLVLLRGVSGVGWDESVRLRMESGETRFGTVLEVDRDLAVVQVMEGTQGLDLQGTRVGFTGEVLHIPSNVWHEAEALEDTLDVDIFDPPRQDWLDRTDDYLRR